MMSEKKLSIFRPLYCKVGGRLNRWLYMDHSGNCDIVFRRGGPWSPRSIFTHVHTIIWFLGYGIAWGFAFDKDGKHYVQKEHVMKWDHCEYGCVASKVWFGRMDIHI